MKHGHCVYGENWRQTEERTSLERMYQNLMNAEKKRKEQRDEDMLAL